MKIITYCLVMCFHVHTGDTSSGKSKIINEIIGEKILPTGVRATTTRVCRVKYSKEMKISTYTRHGQIYPESFRNTTVLAEKLKMKATTKKKNITHVDIFMPLPFQQVQFITCLIIYLNDIFASSITLHLNRS